MIKSYFIIFIMLSLSTNIPMAINKQPAMIFIIYSGMNFDIYSQKNTPKNVTKTKANEAPRNIGIG